MQIEVLGHLGRWRQTLVNQATQLSKVQHLWILLDLLQKILRQLAAILRLLFGEYFALSELVHDLLAILVMTPLFFYNIWGSI